MLASSQEIFVGVELWKVCRQLESKREEEEDGDKPSQRKAVCGDFFLGDGELFALDDGLAGGIARPVRVGLFDVVEPVAIVDVAQGNYGDAVAEVKERGQEVPCADGEATESEGHVFWCVSYECSNLSNIL